MRQARQSRARSGRRRAACKAQRGPTRRPTGGKRALAARAIGALRHAHLCPAGRPAKSKRQAGGDRLHPRAASGRAPGMHGVCGRCLRPGRTPARAQLAAPAVNDVAPLTVHTPTQVCPRVSTRPRLLLPPRGLARAAAQHAGSRRHAPACTRSTGALLLSTTHISAARTPSGRPADGRQAAVRERVFVGLTASRPESGRPSCMMARTQLAPLVALLVAALCTVSLRGTGALRTACRRTRGPGRRLQGAQGEQGSRGGPSVAACMSA